MKYALVTGANRGLGRGFCKVLTQRGYTVFAAMRDITMFQPDNQAIIPVEMRVDDDDSIRRVHDTLRSQGVQLNLLINNAGVNRRSESIDGPEKVSQLDYIDRQALLHMFNVNSISPLIMSRYLSPLMTTENCFIINITSGRASFGNESNNANYGYRASKVALNMFTKAQTFDLPENIKTFAVHPGLVKSDMNPTGDTSPEAAAEQIMTITDNWDEAKNGAFLDTDGSLFPL